MAAAFSRSILPRETRTSLMRLPEQVPRLAAVFAVAIVALIAARAVLVPATFGEYGHYRAAAVATVAERPLQFAGRQECEDCHEDVAEARVGGHHRNISCEVCHTPQIAHVEDPVNVTPPAPRDRTFCVLCHAYNASRPTGFPQIDPVSHNPLKNCISCHDPHAPVPPQVPEECSACHGSIARQKSVSHHVALACTNCHTVQQAHKVTPRAVRPTKPVARETCAQCHAAANPLLPDAPQLDFGAHYPRYLCWQCHYPHQPET